MKYITVDESQIDDKGNLTLTDIQEKQMQEYLDSGAQVTVSIKHKDGISKTKTPKVKLNDEGKPATEKDWALLPEVVPLKCSVCHRKFSLPKRLYRKVCDENLMVACSKKCRKVIERDLKIRGVDMSSVRWL